MSVCQIWGIKEQFLRCVLMLLCGFTFLVGIERVIKPDFYVYKMTALDTLYVVSVRVPIHIHVTLTTRTWLFAHV